MTHTEAGSPVALDPEEKFDQEAAARHLFGEGGSSRTLETWRVRGGGPLFLKVGRRVIYRRRDLDAWLAERERASTSDTRRAAPRELLP